MARRIGGWQWHTSERTHNILIDASPLFAPPLMIALNDLARNHQAGLEELRGACERVISSGWFVTGKEVTRFEGGFADYRGAARCIELAMTRFNSL